MFHRVASVKTGRGYSIEAVFQDGEKRRYDLTPLFSKFPAFQALKTIPGLFESVHVDTGGYAVAWNDDLDLESEDVWELGTPV
jgi:hypothetical protein